MSTPTPLSFRERRFGLRRRRGVQREVTAFVLSGGASLGAMQVGMLHALYERSITPDLIVGTSVGALNGAFIASRPQTVQTAEQLEAVWTQLRRDTLFPLSIPGLVSGLRGRRDHLVSDHGLRNLAKAHLHLDHLDDAAIPLHLTTYDVLSGDDVRLSSGPAMEALLAAAAIPGVYPPVEIDGRLLVDGGVVNNTPLSHAIDLGATRVYVLPTQAPAAGGAVRPRGALDAAVSAVALLINRRLEHDIDHYDEQAEITLLPAVNEARVQATDFTQAARLIHDARDAARELLATPAEHRALAS